MRIILPATDADAEAYTVLQEYADSLVEMDFLGEGDLYVLLDFCGRLGVEFWIPANRFVQNYHASILRRCQEIHAQVIAGQFQEAEAL